MTDLTARENEVLTPSRPRVLQRRNRRHADRQESTIKTHVNRILMKLDLRDRMQAAVLAYETGFVQPGESSQPAPSDASP